MGSCGLSRCRIHHAEETERFALRRAELMPGHRRHGDEIALLQGPHLAADQAMAASAQDQDRMHVLVPLQRREPAGRDLEIAQLARHRRVREQHLPRHRLEQRAFIFFVGAVLDALPAVIVAAPCDEWCGSSCVQPIPIVFDGGDKGGGFLA